MSAAQEIVSLVRLLAALDPLAKESVERTLGVELAERAIANRYWHSYKAAPRQGPFAEVELRVPGEGATSKEKLLNLEVRADAAATEDEIGREIGAGEIYQIIPQRRPEGTVSYKYLLGKRTVFLEFTARSKRLLSISLHAATP